MVATALNPPVDRARYFYVAMAVVSLLIAVGSFAGTYWLQVPAGTFVGSPLVHAHAMVFTAWPLLYLSQTWLASQGRLDHHRAWGLAGISLATAMLFLGLATAVNSMTHGLASGYGDASRAFLIVPATAILTFFGLFVAAVSNINRPEWHKRFMTLATVAVLQAAMARVFFLVITGGGPGLRPGTVKPTPVATTLGAAGVIDLLIVAGIIFDWRTRGRPHPAYLWGGAAIVAVQLLRVPVSTTPQWLAFANFLAGFAG